MASIERDIGFLIAAQQKANVLEVDTYRRWAGGGLAERPRRTMLTSWFSTSVG